jgi:hemolysin III
MKKRLRLSERHLPDYTRGEEIMNMVTHIVGGAMGIAALTLCVIFAALNGNVYGVVGSAIYGGCMIALYSMSSIYHGLRPGTGKKVMQILDHCTIYFLIAGTYTVIALSALRPAYPLLGWSMFGFQWALTALAVTLTAIDLKKYNVFSMICYICMGWAILPFAKQTVEVLTMPGFVLLLAGGISFTVGAVLYGVGSKKRWLHSIFHIFVVLGSLLQFLCILFYAV